MPRTTSLLLRALFLLGFIIVLPLIALPPVVRYLDQVLYGKSHSTIPPLTAQHDSPQVVEPQISQPNSPASYDSPYGGRASPASGPSLYEGLDSLTAPPPLAPPPAFPVGARDSNIQFQDEPSADNRDNWIAKVQQIRERLEVLGAKYILLETADGSGKYRFHCQMLLEETSPYTRDFEAISTDPLFAAQDVLREVEQWRTASRPSGSRLQ